jgi:hypothetical protein
MTIGENVSLDRHPLAQRALAGEPAAVDLRRNRFDGHPATPVGALRWPGGRLDRRADDPLLNRCASHGANRTHLAISSPLAGEVARSAEGPSM